METKACHTCGEHKPLDTYHFIPTDAGGWRRDCRVCKADQDRQRRARNAERLREYNKKRWERIKSDPERLAVAREAKRRYEAELRRQAPEHVAERHRRYRQRLKRDPARHARVLESKRMAYRLHREMEGHAVRPGATKYRVRQGGGRVPSAPLAEKLRLLARASDLEQLCEEAGISSRQVRRWGSGDNPMVNFSLADQILTRLDLNWHDVWPEEGMSVERTGPAGPR